MASTVSGVLLTGVHGSRPSSGVTAGTLYACSTHSLIYQTSDTGSTWATWATLTGTGLSDPMTTRGDVIIRNSSNTTARLGIGSSGKVLSSDGTDISWQTPSAGAAGALTFLEAHTASSSATLDFTSFISSTYDRYQLELIDVIPATNSVTPQLRFSTDGGSTYDTTAIYFSSRNYVGVTTADSGAYVSTVSATAMAIAGTDLSNNTTWGGLSGRVELYNPLSASTYKRVLLDLLHVNTAPNVYHFRGAGSYNSATAVNAVRFLFSSGNIASGTIRAYGIAKS